MNKKNKFKINIFTLFFCLFCIYIIISLYFSKHFFIGTKVNGINISCKTINEANIKIKKKLDNYNLQLEERNGVTENILGKDINLKYEEDNFIKNIKKSQNPILWPFLFFQNNNHEIIEMFSYDKDLLNSIFNELNCINGENIIKPVNAKLEYSNKGYIIINETYGNTVNKGYLYAYIINSIQRGITKINFDDINCYENPKFTSTCEEILKAQYTLNQYISSIIYYSFDGKLEVLDSSTFNKWITLNDSMEIIFNEEMINEYINELSKKYNTFGKSRDFLTSTGKVVNILGGNYGWIVDKNKEKSAIIEDIKKGETKIREPIYLQRALGDRSNDIGKTYVEINLTMQYLWFYKDGNIIVQGDIVSGNVSRNFATPEGTYILNYKQKNATLKGAGYSSSVTYWMPFNSNIGLHDASWRSSFGGNIYKTNGSHGCINTSDYVAKKVYENIEPGTPIVCYSDN